MLLRAIGSVAIVACLTGGAWAASADKAKPSLRDQEQAACYNDATTLCHDFIPDEKKIETCMRAKLDQVSPECKKFFK